MIRRWILPLTLAVIVGGVYLALKSAGSRQVNLPSTAVEAQDYLLVNVKRYIPDIGSKKCVTWVTGETADENKGYWLIETHAIQKDNSLCPGDTNVSPRIASYWVDKLSGSIFVYSDGGELLTLDEYFRDSPYTGT